jgi:hypothetical protein
MTIPRQHATLTSSDHRHSSDSHETHLVSPPPASVRHPSILQLYPARPSPPVTLLHSILCLENALTQPSIIHHLHHSTTRRHDYCHHRQPIPSGRPFALLIPAERVTLRIANAVIVSNTFETALTAAHRLPSLQLHQSTRNNWTASTYSNIHWPAYYRSIKKRKLTSQLRIHKFSNGWLPVGRIRHRINPNEPESCPSCLGRNETCDHVMRCREHRRANLNSSQIDDIMDPLIKTKSPRPLTTAIVQGITGWYRGPNYQIPLPWASKFITVLFDQVEDQRKLRNEALHGRDDAEHSLFHRRTTLHPRYSTLRHS